MLVAYLIALVLCATWRCWGSTTWADETTLITDAPRPAPATQRPGPAPGPGQALAVGGAGLGTPTEGADFTADPRTTLTATGPVDAV